jgi:hypothetical protein
MPIYNRMPTRPEIWVDLLFATCVWFGPFALQCALGLQMVMLGGASVR